MKHLIKILLVVVILGNSECFAQPLMKSLADAPKILENKHLFINKPLKTILGEIGPEIKRASGEPRIGGGGYFVFRFASVKQCDSIRSIGKLPATIVVYVKEFFDWEFAKRPAGKQFDWTNEDVQKFQNLTVAALRAYGTE